MLLFYTMSDGNHRIYAFSSQRKNLLTQLGLSGWLCLITRGLLRVRNLVLVLATTCLW